MSRQQLSVLASHCTSNSAHSEAPDEEPLPKIHELPLAIIIEMISATLEKVTSINDTHREFLHANMPSAPAMAAAFEANRAPTPTSQVDPENYAPSEHSKTSHIDPQTVNVLAFHGRNVPSISISDYLTRITRYCPASYEVYVSLLVYFDRVTRRINTPYIRKWVRRRHRKQLQRLRAGRTGGQLDHTPALPQLDPECDCDGITTPPPSSSSDNFGHRSTKQLNVNGSNGADAQHKTTSPPSPSPSDKSPLQPLNGERERNSAGTESCESRETAPLAWMTSDDYLLRKMNENHNGSDSGSDGSDSDGINNVNYNHDDDEDDDFDDEEYDDAEERQEASELSRCFVVDSLNVHRLIIAGITCASKFFGDVFFTNGRYAKVCAPSLLVTQRILMSTKTVVNRSGAYR